MSGPWAVPWHTLVTHWPTCAGLRIIQAVALGASCWQAIGPRNGTIGTKTKIYLHGQTDKDRQTEGKASEGAGRESRASCNELARETGGRAEEVI